MADLWDAVTWTNLEGLPGAKAGYIDGPASQWPAEAWTALAPGPFVRISVFANITADAFDMEGDNASPGVVMAAVAGRTAAGKRSWAYFAENTAPAVYAAAKAKGVPLLDRSMWPRPGCYIWASDPSGNIAAGRWRVPVDPVAVQDSFYGTHDHSTLYVALDVAGGPSGASTAPPTPPTMVPTTVQEERQMIMIREASDGAVATFDGAHKVHVPTPEDEQALLAAGIRQVEVTPGFYATIPDAT